MQNTITSDIKKATGMQVRTSLARTQDGRSLGYWEVRVPDAAQADAAAKAVNPARYLVTRIVASLNHTGWIYVRPLHRES
jgi:hypothetical protein